MVEFKDVIDLFLPGLAAYEKRYGVRLGLMVNYSGERVWFTDGDRRPLHGPGGQPIVAMTKKEVQDNTYKFKWRGRVMKAIQAAGGKEA
jgi:hypothetical protein